MGTQATERGQRVAVVTGAASGIGLATARRLGGQGVQVAGFDVASGARAQEAEVCALRLTVDVGDAAAVARAVDEVRSGLGRVDVVVNAAGVPAGGALDAADAPAVWERAMRVNLDGAVNVVRACLADLLGSPSGRIVNVASTEALGAARNAMPYTVSKHALLGFTRSLAVEYGRTGLTANCVCPGATLTGMTENIPEASRAAFARRRVPAGRYGSPEEIAYVIAALAAPEASYVNGAVVPVDGGLTAQA